MRNAKIETYYSKHTSTKLAKVNVPAGRRTIIYLGVPYFINYPALEFAIHFQLQFEFIGLYISASGKRMLIMPHTTRTGKVCLQQPTVPLVLSSPTLEGLCEMVMEKFWTSRFIDHFRGGPFEKEEFIRGLRLGKIEVSNLPVYYGEHWIKEPIISTSNNPMIGEGI